MITKKFMKEHKNILKKNIELQAKINRLETFVLIVNSIVITKDKKNFYDNMDFLLEAVLELDTQRI